MKKTHGYPAECTQHLIDIFCMVQCNAMLSNKLFPTHRISWQGKKLITIYSGGGETPKMSCN
jgi:hypothetical protein